MIEYFRKKPSSVVLVVIVLVAIALHLFASKILNASYAESKYPVPYFDPTHRFYIYSFGIYSPFFYPCAYLSFVPNRLNVAKGHDNLRNGFATCTDIRCARKLGVLSDARQSGGFSKLAGIPVLGLCRFKVCYVCVRVCGCDHWYFGFFCLVCSKTSQSGCLAICSREYPCFHASHTI